MNLAGGAFREPEGRDIAAGFEPEHCAAVMDQVELDGAAAPDELLLALFVGLLRREIAPDQLRIDVEEGARDATCVEATSVTRRRRTPDRVSVRPLP